VGSNEEIHGTGDDEINVTDGKYSGGRR